MKWVLFLFILTLFSCAKFVSRDPADKATKRHIVFDIDWTIVSEIKNPSSSDLKNKRVIEVEGKHYFVSDGLENFIEDILSHKTMRISFYSGGKESRNHTLLSKIKLKNGKSLLEISYKVLSNEDLTAVPGAPKGARFAERFRKDLTKVSKDLEELIMLDDTANFVVDSSDNQNQHVFFIGKSFEYFEKYSDAEGKVGEYVPRSYDQWLLNKNKIGILNIVFNEAYAESAETGIPFSEAMKKREGLLNLQGHEWNVHSKRLYKQLQKMPLLESISLGSDCHSLMAPFNIN